MRTCPEGEGRGYQGKEVETTGSALKAWGRRRRRDERVMDEGRGRDTGIGDGCSQTPGGGKEARNSSTANRAGIGGRQACSRFTTSCPSADACQSGM